MTSQIGAARVLVSVNAGDPPWTRDAAGFDRLYQAYGGRLFAFLHRLCGSRDAAEDLYQDSWLRVARAWPGLAPGADVAAWLYTIARNVFISGHRSRLVERRGLANLRVLPIAGPPRPDGALEAARGLTALDQAFGALGDDDRTILWLAAVEQMDQARVAEIIGIGHAALRQRLSRARGKLAAALAALEHEGGEGGDARGDRRRPGGDP